MKKCKRCGKQFIPKENYYNICDGCFESRHEWEDSPKSRLFREFNLECAYCGEKPSHEDHVIPVDEIYESPFHVKKEYKEIYEDPTNYVPACVRCNSSKGKKDLVEWYSKQPFFSIDRLYKILCHMRHPKQKWCDYIFEKTGKYVF
jgi:5-methylcytosine-specific restriction endonuclease McrA